MLTSGYRAISAYRSIQASNNGAAVDPKGVPGTLALWLRADLGVTNTAGKVSQWLDQSANAFAFTQAVSGNRPTQTTSNANLGNQASIEWAAATPTALTHASARPIATDGPRTIFAVVRPTNATGGVVIDFDLGVTGFAWMWFFSSNTFVFTDGVAISCTLASDPTFINTARVNTYIDPGPATLSLFRTNKTTVTTITNVPSETAGSGVSIGARGTGAMGSGFTGSIAEIIVYSGVLSASSCVLVENYLHQRYAIAA